MQSQELDSQYYGQEQDDSLSLQESNSQEFADDSQGPLHLQQTDKQSDDFIGKKTLKQLNVNPLVSQYFINFKKYKKSAFMSHFKFNDKIQCKKSVCAKIIGRGQTIAQCFDCATDHTCIQCMDCFRTSNHQGHKVVIKLAYGGCCDCGDIQAWKKDGFCQNHTGEAKDIQIDQNEKNHFVNIMTELIFLIFWEFHQNNENHHRNYSKSLVDNLQYMNQKGIYYNKLTKLVFEAKLSEKYLISKNCNSRTILLNLLNPKISSNIIDEWINLFMMMFQYYGFKKLLLSTYIRHFSIIYDSDSQSVNRGTSISCQLLTSHQLVHDYVQDETITQHVPLGGDINVNKISSFQNTYIILYHDLNYFNHLQGDTPRVYWKFHVKHQHAFLNLFSYTTVLKREMAKDQEDSAFILILSKWAKYFQFQYRMLKLLAGAAYVLQKDKQTLAIAIKTLYDQALIQKNPKHMIIFKPLIRALTLFIFAYFDMNLSNLHSKQTRLKFTKQVLKVDDDKFIQDLNILFKSALQTYLFHSKILSTPGYNSTLYSYLYYYKIKEKFVSSLDGLMIKTLATLHSNTPTISPKDYLNEEIQQSKQELQKKTFQLSQMLVQLNIVTASKCNQLEIACQMNKNCEVYNNYIENLLIKLINQQKGSISLATIKQYQSSFFHPNIQLTKILKNISTFDKVKKIFILKQQYQLSSQNVQDLINYNDFRCNLTNKSQFQNPDKTLQLIKDQNGQQIFNNIFSSETIKKFLKQIILITYQKTNKLSDEKLRPLFSQIMKIIYLKKQLKSELQQIQIITNVIKKIPSIQNILSPFYRNFLMVQQRIQIQLMSPLKGGQHSIKSGQHLIKEQQKYKKQKLLSKFQLKKQKILQKFKTNSQSFQPKQIEITKDSNQIINQTKQTTQTVNCIICKNQDKENMVYFVNVSFRNHQKLLQLGKGVLCLSVQSCYHTIDFDCYSEMQNKVKHKKRPVVHCPFCKFSANTYLPLSAKSQRTTQAFKKLQMVILAQKQFDEISVLQQVIKSFYHYALISYIDPQRCINRRLKIYKVILDILKENIELYDLKKVYLKFINNKINLNPKVNESIDKNQEIQAKLALQTLIQNNQNFSQANIQALQPQQVSLMLQLLGAQETTQNQSGVISRIFDHLKSKFARSESQKQQKQQKLQTQQNKMTPILSETLDRLFAYLQIKKVTQKKQQQICIQLAPSVQIGLSALFSGNINTKQLNQVIQPSNLCKLRDLPLTFKPLSLLKTCDDCEQISHNLCICLLCQWKGCLRNCQPKNNRKCGPFQHLKSHGEITLFLYLSTCVVYILNSNGSTYADCIYKDQWDQHFHMKKQWDKFYLDQTGLNKIKNKFLHDQ